MRILAILTPGDMETGVIAGSARETILTDSSKRCDGRDQEGLGKVATVISACTGCSHEELLHVGKYNSLL